MIRLFEQTGFILIGILYRTLFQQIEELSFQFGVGRLKRTKSVNSQHEDGAPYSLNTLTGPGCFDQVSRTQLPNYYIDKLSSIAKKRMKKTRSKSCAKPCAKATIRK